MPNHGRHVQLCTCSVQRVFCRVTMARLVHGFDNTFEITGVQVPNTCSSHSFHVSLTLEMDGQSKRIDQMRYPVLALQLDRPTLSIRSGWCSFNDGVSVIGRVNGRPVNIFPQQLQSPSWRGNTEWPIMVALRRPRHNGCHIEGKTSPCHGRCHHMCRSPQVNSTC